jgi:antibiotic biosynthesis monooxygenase (ABM) superfamily enzyme
MSASKDVSGVVALVSKVQINAGEAVQLTSWLTRLMMRASEVPGFLSADIIPPASEEEITWTLVQRFRHGDKIAAWKDSPKRAELFAEVKEMLAGNWTHTEDEVSEYGFRGSIATAIITQIKPEADSAYRVWEGKIQGAQARFPGYRGAYIQPPIDGTSNEWITLLRFDKPESLDRWFDSPERIALLPEKEQFIKSVNFQRMVPSYPGWFPVNEKTGQGTARWKTAILVLLCLYPIVVLESRYLQPLLDKFALLHSIFIGNVISVAIITWLAMPTAVKLFESWLCLPKDAPLASQLKGAAIIVCLYAIEMLLLSIK